MVFQDWAVPQLCFPQRTCITIVLFSLNKVSPLTTPPFEDSCWCWIGKMTSVDTFCLNSHAGINLILASLYKPHPAYPVLPFSSYLKPFIWSIYKPQNGGCAAIPPFARLQTQVCLLFFFFLEKIVWDKENILWYSGLEERFPSSLLFSTMFVVSKNTVS